MSNFIKKSFLISMVVVSSLWGVMGVVTVSQAAVASAGDLIKTASSPAVYYLGADGKKYVFHHAREYFTWYSDFSMVKIVPQDEMVGYTLGTTIVVRPGTRLVQFVEVNGDGTWSVANTPQVYVVDVNGTLHQIDSAATAVAMYGAAWETMIVPLPNYLNANYDIGSMFTASSMYPTGTLVKTAASDQVYYISGSAKRPVTAEGFSANRFNFGYILTVADLSGYTDGTSITSLEGAIANPMGGNVQAGTGLTVSLASTNPGVQVAPLGATNVPLMRVTLMASADGAVTLDGLTFNRQGPGRAADFTSVYLYDGATRLTNAKTINSTTNKVSFINLNNMIAAGASKTLTLVGDITTTNYAGDVDYFTLGSTDIATSAALSGSFPLTSSTVTLGSVAAGEATIIDYGTLPNPSVGETNVDVSQFNIAIDSVEDVSLQRISLYQGGTVANSNLSNFKLYQGGNQLATVANVNSKNLIIFELAAPFVITKGQNKTFTIKADISGGARASETIVTYLENTADLYAVGATYGYGAEVVNTGFDGGTGDLSTVTIQGGQVTVVKSGSAQTYSVNDDAKSWLDFTITAGVNLEIRTWRVELHTQTVDLDNASTTLTSIDNVRIAATDGSFSTDSVEGDTFTDVGTYAGVLHSYTDTLEMAAGTTKNFQVLVDTDSSLSTTYAYYAVLGNSVAGSTYTFSSTSIKNTDNNQWITDIVPSSQTTGYNMTYAASSLTTSLGNYTGVKTFVRGTDDAELLYYNLAAGTGGAVNVSSIQFAGYIDGDGTGTTMAFNSDTTASGGTATLQDYVNSYTLWEKSGTTYTQIGSVESINSGYITFDSLNYTIPSGSTKTLVLKGDISQNATNERVAFDVWTTTASNTYISATDSSGNTITAITAVRNLTSGAITESTIATLLTYASLTTSGTLYVADNDSPEGDLVVAGSANVPVLKLKFNAVNGGFRISKMRIANAVSDTARSVGNVTISYRNSANEVRTASMALASGVADFNLGADPLNHIYVASNGQANVDVTVDLNAISGTSGAYSGDGVRFYFDENGAFEAIPLGGGNTITETSSTADVTGNTYIVHKAVPTFTRVAQGSGDTTFSSGGAYTIFKFTVAASEGSSIALKKIKLGTLLSDTSAAAWLSLTALRVTENGTELTQGDTATTNGYRVYDGVGATTASLDQAEWIDSQTGTEQNMYLVFNDDRTIGAGQSKTYEVKGTLTVQGTTATGNTFSVRTYLDDGETATQATANKEISVFGECSNVSADGALSKYCLFDGTSTSEAAGYIWSDTSGTDGNGLHTDIDDAADGASSADWFDGYELETLGSSYDWTRSVSY